MDLCIKVKGGRTENRKYGQYVNFIQYYIREKNKYKIRTTPDLFREIERLLIDR